MLNVTLAKTAPAKAEVTIRFVIRGEGVRGRDAKQLKALGFEAKYLESIRLPKSKADTEVLVGLGAADELTAGRLRRAAVVAVRACGELPRAALDLKQCPPGLDPAFAVQLVAEGLLLGGYRFDTYRSKPKKSLRSVALLTAGTRDEREALKRAKSIVGAQLFARDLVNEPGGALTPTVAADRVAERAGAAGVTVEVLDRARIAEERLGGVLAVNQGSVEEPRFVRLSYRPEGATSRVALIGKGITFDSGGLSIKPAEGMIGMKMDMGGAAAVAAATCAAAELGLNVAIEAYLPFTDNMTGGAAQRPGDIYTARNGTTVEVLNTDAEGRLILADALAWAAEEKPDVMVDVATLTGACMVALGDKVTGLLSNNDGAADEVLSAAAAGGEAAWRLPLVEEYRGLLDSTIADIKNIGSRYGGAITAGLFLAEFVTDVPWVHLDIAGTAMSDGAWAEGPAGATGTAVRTLVGFLAGRS
jgi:leucyl aminopeptidase